MMLCLLTHLNTLNNGSRSNVVQMSGDENFIHGLCFETDESFLMVPRRCDTSFPDQVTLSHGCLMSTSPSVVQKFQSSGFVVSEHQRATGRSGEQ